MKQHKKRPDYRSFFIMFETSKSTLRNRNPDGEASLHF